MELTNYGPIAQASANSLDTNETSSNVSWVGVFVLGLVMGFVVGIQYQQNLFLNRNN